MGPRIFDGPPGRNPTITVNGRSYEVADIEVRMGGNRLQPVRPLKPETAERIAKCVRHHLEEGAKAHAFAMQALGIKNV